ncbi:hypothetical protein LMH87_001134 [Akanthomyces muscarius]|uniref:Uncharacterized protein n=1 Tax=Akanthomyces muscarius TaxID=2231603 RepID=A0A9W8QHL4_AKAMU|nr:hypothetical protein LMH87_001134 [Akanthomyces muscarius]KAJ4155911.1 hypothetical protein LMH87_001134 [Akanthomyces muscarius]
MTTATLTTRGLSDVNPKKVFLWGIGHSGEASEAAAVFDRRIAGVILVMPLQTGKYGYDNWPAGGRSASETKADFWRSGPPGRGPRRRQRVDAHRRCFLLVVQGPFYLAEEGGSVFDNKVAVTSLHPI